MNLFMLIIFFLCAMYAMYRKDYDAMYFAIIMAAFAEIRLTIEDLRKEIKNETNRRHN